MATVDQLYGRFDENWKLARHITSPTQQGHADLSKRKYGPAVITPADYDDDVDENELERPISPYPNITQNSRGRWRCEFQLANVHHRIPGSFKTSHGAARAYNEYVCKHGLQQYGRRLLDVKEG